MSKSPQKTAKSGTSTSANSKVRFKSDDELVEFATEHGSTASPTATDTAGKKAAKASAKSSKSKSPSKDSSSVVPDAESSQEKSPAKASSKESGKKSKSTSKTKKGTATDDVPVSASSTEPVSVESKVSSITTGENSADRDKSSSKSGTKKSVHKDASSSDPASALAYEQKSELPVSSEQHKINDSRVDGRTEIATESTEETDPVKLKFFSTFQVFSLFISFSNTQTIRRPWVYLLIFTPLTDN
jgi:hypothetical protein